MTKALELAKFGRETPPTGTVVGDSDAQTLSSKTFSDGPVFSGLNANGVPFLNASKVLSSSSTFVFDGTNIGLGIASPAYKFDVQGSGAGVGVARFASNDTNTTTALAIFQRSGGAVSAAVKYNATNSPLTMDFGTTTNHALTFITDDTERVRIANGGNVGVGTPSPFWPLTVKSAASGTAAMFLYDGTFGGTDEVNIGLRFYNGGLASDIPQVRLRAYGTTNYTGNFAVSVLQGGTYPNALIERFTIQGNTGNVGVGSTVPGYKFVVSNASNTGRIAAFFNSTAGSVGIGDSGFIHIGGEQLGNYYGVDIGFVNSSVTPAVHQSNMVFRTAYGEETPQERMRITYAGNISFGSTGTADRPVHLIGSGTRQYIKAETTTNSLSNEAGFEIKTPSSNFLIGSHGSTNALWIYDVNGVQERLRIGGDGRVSIGTANLDEKLTVAGNIRLYGNQAVVFQQLSGVAVGAISFRNSSGVQKAAIGSYYNVADEGAIEFIGPTSSTTQMILRSNGSLVIGDTTSQYSSKLYVNGAIAARHGGVDGTYQPAFIAGYTSNYTEANVISTAVSSDGSGSGFRFEVSDGAGVASRTNTAYFNRNKAYFNTNVGINTTDPKNPLHVADSRNYTYNTIADHTTNMAGIRVTNSNNGDNWAGIWFATGSGLGTHWSGIAGARTASATTWGTHLAFYTHEDATVNVTQATERMRLDSAGRLGIGTTNATYPLTVNGPPKMTNSGFNFNSIDKDASSGTVSFTYGEIGGGMDNMSAFIMIHIYHSTSAVPGKSAIWLGTRQAARGSGGTVTQISTTKENVTTLTVTTNGSDGTVITTDGGANLRCRLTVLAGGGTSVPQY